jgi:hypothetical protein
MCCKYTYPWLSQISICYSAAEKQFPTQYIAPFNPSLAMPVMVDLLEYTRGVSS